VTSSGFATNGVIHHVGQFNSISVTWSTPIPKPLPTGIKQVCEAVVNSSNRGKVRWGVDKIRDDEMPWGVHRQGGFIDPFGHLWLVGDRSPLSAHDTRH
jgi:hypothetical protein